VEWVLNLRLGQHVNAVRQCGITGAVLLEMGKVLPLNSEPYTLTFNPQPSTFNPQSSTLNPEAYTHKGVGCRFEGECGITGAVLLEMGKVLPPSPQPATLNPDPSTLNPQPSTLNPQPSTLTPEADRAGRGAYTYIYIYIYIHIYT
jgi:hypothetical protein